MHQPRPPPTQHSLPSAGGPVPGRARERRPLRTGQSFAVQVPATSANLGPGFDALGLALDLANTVHITSSDAVEIHVQGEGAGELAESPDNLTYRALALVAERAGASPPPVRLDCDNAIPLARGLGSSSAAIVAGLVAGNRLLGDPLTTTDLLTLAVEIEGHPDNVTPALLGGVRACVHSDHGVLQAPVPLARPLHAVLFIPDFPMATEAARRLLPREVSLADAVFNVSRTALLVAALVAGDYALLREATRDRLHQPARAALFPAMETFFQAALDAGAVGAFLSGAGSTLLALVDGPTDTVRAAFEHTAQRQDVAGRTVVAAVGVQGAQVLP